MIFDTCHEDKTNINWMPAHISKTQIGAAMKGDGQCLTHDDWKGNQLADVLAKKGAKTHRVNWHTRRMHATAEAVALKAAVQLGITTHAANNFPVTSTDLNGKEHTNVMRDSEGMPKHKRRRKAPPAVIVLEDVSLINDEPSIIVIDADSTDQTAAPPPTYRRRRTSGKKQKRHTEPQLDPKKRRVAPTSEYLQRITARLPRKGV